MYWARVRSLGEKQISLVAILSVLAAPHLHFHDLVFLIAPVVSQILVLNRKKYLPEQDVALLPVGVSLALLFNFFSEFSYTRFLSRDAVSTAFVLAL